MNLQTLAIIQARMGSSRLPGKVLLDLAGKSMIQHVIERARRAQTVDSVLIATTTDPSDNPVAALAASMDIPCYRGALHDVLDRYYQAAKMRQAGVIVRITADCPLIDPAVIDETVRLVTHHSPLIADFACNRLPPPLSRSFPIGLDVEACSFGALERAWRESTETFHREHVMPYIYEGVSLTNQSPLTKRHSLTTGISPRNFRITQLHHAPNYGALRWTVDTPEDLAFMRKVFARLPGNDFTWYDVLEIVRKHPELAQINAAVRHKTMTEVDNRSTGN